MLIYTSRKSNRGLQFFEKCQRYDASDSTSFCYDRSYPGGTGLQGEYPGIFFSAKRIRIDRKGPGMVINLLAESNYVFITKRMAICHVVLRLPSHTREACGVAEYLLPFIAKSRKCPFVNSSVIVATSYCV
jgi:hypothetical protein